MENIHERIKMLRKSLSITQQDMADRIHVGRSAVAQYEMGRNPPSDAVISLICREFNVNELWLRHGDGEMFVEKSPDDEIENFMLSILRAGDDRFKRRFAKAISKLSEEDWKRLEEFAKELQEP